MSGGNVRGGRKRRKHTPLRNNHMLCTANARQPFPSRDQGRNADVKPNDIAAAALGHSTMMLSSPAFMLSPFNDDHEDDVFAFESVATVLANTVIIVGADGPDDNCTGRDQCSRGAVESCASTVTNGWSSSTDRAKRPRS